MFVQPEYVQLSLTNDIGTRDAGLSRRSTHCKFIVIITLHSTTAAPHMLSIDLKEIKTR